MMRKTGFTLIELLVVVSIISLLSSIVLSTLNTARAKSRFSEAVSQMRQMKLAADNYFSDNGSYPADASIGALPAGLSTYLKSWPSPSCSNLVYDWNNFSSGNNVHVSLRTVSPAADVYYFCIYAAAGTSCGPGAGSDIQLTTTRQISC